MKQRGSDKRAKGKNKVEFCPVIQRGTLLEMSSFFLKQADETVNLHASRVPMGKPRVAYLMGTKVSETRPFVHDLDGEIQLSI